MTQEEKDLMNEVAKSIFSTLQDYTRADLLLKIYDDGILKTDMALGSAIQFYADANESREYALTKRDEYMKLPEHAKYFGGCFMANIDMRLKDMSEKFSKMDGVEVVKPKEENEKL